MRQLALSLPPAAPPLAKSPQTARDAASFATGKTVTYQRPGRIAGTNDPLPNRKVNCPKAKKGRSKGTRSADGVCIFPGDPRQTFRSQVRRSLRLKAHSLGGVSGKQPVPVVARCTPLICVSG